MKRPNLGGMTAVAALVLAIGAGAVGGAMAVSGAAPSPVAPTQQVHSVAEEDATVPVPSATPAPVVAESGPVPAPVVHDTASVSEAAPIVEPVAPKGETPQQAADRAKVEADRASTEADRAAAEAKNAGQASPAPVAPAPVVTPTPQPVVTPKPECEPGQMRPYAVNERHADGSLWRGPIYACQDGKWVQVEGPKMTTPPPPPPVVVTDGAETPAPTKS